MVGPGGDRKLSSALGTAAERVARTRGRAARPRAPPRASLLRPEELRIRRRSWRVWARRTCTYLPVTGLVLRLQRVFDQSPRAPPGCLQASCFFLVALDMCIPRTLPGCHASSSVQGVFGQVHARDLASFLRVTLTSSVSGWYLQTSSYPRWLWPAPCLMGSQDRAFPLSRRPLFHTQV